MVAPMTVADALRLAQALGIERLDAQRLLAHLLLRTRSWLIAHADDVLDAAQAIDAQRLLQRCAAGEPLAYLLGSQAFHGVVLEVDARVLVPRADTEVLVDWALERLASSSAATAHPRVIDLGTGSGAIALAVKQAHVAAQVCATDVSADALAVARANATRLGLDVRLLASSWWTAVAQQRFELVLANPPYIAAGDAHLPALRHEPTLALSPGGDGLDALREIVAGAPAHLEPAGWLLLEHGHDQADAVRSLLTTAGFTQIDTRTDPGGQPRCTGGQWPAVPPS